MRGRNLLAIALVTAIACSDGSNSENKANEKGSNTGGATLTGTIYGFTAGRPDSQRVAIAGATVTLIRVGDFPPPNQGPDTTGGPTPPGGDTTFTVRQGIRSLLDTMLTPPDTSDFPPPPVGGCEAGTTVATAVSGSDGRWSASGLEEGVYNVIIDGPAGGGWSGIEYCGLQVMEHGENDVTLYLPASPGS